MNTTSSHNTILTRTAMTLLVLLTSVQWTWATDFITDVMLIGGSQDEVNTLKSTYTSKGWTVIDQDLNKGCGSKSDYIYLLYKTANDGNESATFITDFYISTVSGTAAESLSYNNRTYSLTPYDGGSHFESVKGDLNSNAGGADIHLYYTKNNYNGRAIKSITFNDDQNGAVGENGGTTGFDLNKGCGSGSDYIYMHPQLSAGWIITKNYTGDQCYIDGYEGLANTFTTITIPYSIDNATVIGVRMNFSAFKNLETMNIYRYTLIDRMPSVRGCSKFKNVNVLSPNGDISEQNTLPDNITYVPGYTFAGTAIQTHTMPNVTEVGSSAFEDCDSLTSVTFGKAAIIGLNAFSKINNKTTSGNQTTYERTTITYPGPLSDWNWNSYDYSPNLVVNCRDGSCGWCGDEYNASTMYKDACLYWVLKNGDLTIDCIPLDGFFERYGASQVIKTHQWTTYKDNILSLSLSNVYAIGENAFTDCTYLGTVTIPNSVTCIGDSAFYGCNELWSVSIPNSVTSIGNYAFYDCNNLRTVSINSNAILSKTYSVNSALRDIFGTQVDNYIIGNSVTGIGNYAFYGCNKMTTVFIPNSVTNIGNSAFSGCNNLKTVSIPNNVTSIGSYAFYGCDKLTTVSIPNSVTSIGNSAFSGCDNLKTISINSNAILSKTYSESSALKDIFGTQVEKCILGNEVTGIGDYAFYGCDNLETISIPNSVSGIGKDAFTSCSNLNRIYFDGTETRWGQVTKGNNWKPDATVVHWRCTVTFDTNGHGTAPSAQVNLWSKESKVEDPGALTASGYDFIRWCTNATGTTPWDFSNDIVPGDMTLYAYWVERHELIANTGNSQNLANWSGTASNVQLKGSTIFRDSRWNTLCLPFSLDSLNGTPLEGLTLMELDGANSHLSDGTLTLNFTKADSIEAGKPYLVRDENYYFLIASKADWDAFAARVNAGEKTLQAILVADITEPVTTMVNHYEGIVDGRGHTLTIAYGTEDTPMDMQYAAPFVTINNATIKNLNVKGDIYTSGIHTGGLAGRMIDHCHVEFCNVGVAIHSAVEGAGKHGGYVGHIEGISNVIVNCAFTGSLLGPSTSHCGGFIGENDREMAFFDDGQTMYLPDTPIEIDHCYFNPTNITMDASGSHTFSQEVTSGYYGEEGYMYMGNVDILDCFYARDFGEGQGTATSATGSDLVAILGDAWELRDGQVVPKIIESNIVNPIFWNVTIDATAPTGVYTADDAACFIGCYDPVDITGAERATLFLSDNNKLYYPDASISINAFKGRLLLANALTDPDKGDVNGDKSISVTDVTFLVSYILGTNDDNFVMKNADVNGDGEVSVTDVSALVSSILSGGNSTFNVVTNLNDIPFTYDGGGSGTIR